MKKNFAYVGGLEYYINTNISPILMSREIMKLKQEQKTFSKKVKSLIQMIGSVKGTQFVQFTYTNQEGETARYNLTLGVDYENAMERSLQLLQNLSVTPGSVDEQAKDELVTSLIQRLNRNEAERQKIESESSYLKIVPGVDLHIPSGKIFVRGMLNHKTVVTPGNYVTVNSRPKTIAKKQMMKNLPVGKWRMFCLNADQIKSVNILGDTINFDF